jgi:hypothetical protein
MGRMWRDDQEEMGMEGWIERIRMGKGSVDIRPSAIRTLVGLQLMAASAVQFWTWRAEKTMQGCEDSWDYVAISIGSQILSNKASPLSVLSRAS